MSYCCPIALMEDIRGNGGGGGSAGEDSAEPFQVDAAAVVGFPPLPSHPPTDSDGATTTTSSSTTAASSSSASSSESACESDPPPLSLRGGARRGRRVSDEVGADADDCEDGARKPPPEPQPRPERAPSREKRRHPPQQRLQPADAKGDDGDEMIIEELDFDRIDDPAGRIKAALHHLVAIAKRRKERQRRLRQEQKQEQEQEPDQRHRRHHRHRHQSQVPAPKPLVDMPSAAPSAPAPSSTDPTGGNNEPSSTGRRPIQVIMGWMDSFQDNEQIQLICLQSLPSILEDPPSRLAAQSDGLASVLLYDMAAFPSNALLQLTAFHTLVVLLRPLGADEGAVHKAAAHRGNATSRSSRGIRSIDSASRKRKRGRHDSSPEGPARAKVKVGVDGDSPSKASESGGKKGTTSLADAAYDPRWEENGVRVMLDSLRRYANDRYLQAMGCWAMVNAALYPSLKSSLLRLGAVYAVTNAMMLHPNVEAVQFRGLFALINLVIPDEKSKDGDGSSIRSHIYQIARLTIVAMKNFYANRSILNRGCLVLRNLSLTPAFVRILARTPGCVDMLLHCRQACPRDALVQRSARTIMILVQRCADGGMEETGKGKAGPGGKDTFQLTRPRPVPGSAPPPAAGSSSRAFPDSSGGMATPSQDGPNF